ncbi:uncharacterized protein LOC115880977 [Sitophilus oryzae]|uniref:Uncharacterized protein LOC115880977 n=1 Tax=Sitophilus oryzae TaxID=7048 RepID=A0A6J2XRV6_SITOR|nr:uncharacterized protein LOC115880977 [Sitophilus oryzae]
MTAAAYTIKNKLDEMGIELATNKTEMVILAGRQKMEEVEFSWCNTNIKSTRAVKYMGVWLDKDARMTTHIRKLQEKTEAIIKQLSRVMPNLKGPVAEKRRTLASVVSSTILYASPIWERALKYKLYENILDSINRKIALRVTSAYRTSPTKAILVLAGIPPIKLQTEQRSLVYKHGDQFRFEARNIILDKWQDAWSQYQGWAKTFILDVRFWVNCKAINIDHFVTQAITGNGVFGTYLKRIGKRDSDTCTYCNTVDSPGHTIFLCPRWQTIREETEEICQRKPEENTVGITISEDEGKCRAIISMLHTIMKHKVDDEIKPKNW